MRATKNFSNTACFIAWVLSYGHRLYLELRALHWFLLRYVKVFSTLLSDWLIFFQKSVFVDQLSAQLTLFCTLKNTPKTVVPCSADGVQSVISQCPDFTFINLSIYQAQLTPIRVLALVRGTCVCDVRTRRSSYDDLSLPTKTRFIRCAGMSFLRSCAEHDHSFSDVVYFIDSLLLLQVAARTTRYRPCSCSELCVIVTVIYLLTKVHKTSVLTRSKTPRLTSGPDSFPQIR